jgi:cobalamin biosynthesis Mg chelatase CobN
MDQTSRKSSHAKRETIPDTDTNIGRKENQHSGYEQEAQESKTKDEVKKVKSLADSWQMLSKSAGEQAAPGEQTAKSSNTQGSRRVTAPEEERSVADKLEARIQHELEDQSDPSEEFGFGVSVGILLAVAVGVVVYWTWRRK